MNAKRKILMIVMVILIFIVSGLDSITFYIDNDNYQLFWYPFITSLEIFLLAIYPLLSSIVLKACKYTIWLTFTFCIQQLLTLTMYIHPLDYDVYKLISSDIIGTTILILATMSLLDISKSVKK